MLAYFAVDLVPDGRWRLGINACASGAQQEFAVVSAGVGSVMRIAPYGCAHL